MLPLLISTPHSSDHVPEWIMAQMLKTGESETALRRRILKEGDPFTDILFRIPEAAVIINAPASRFVSDLNRGRDESGNNGVIKLTDFQAMPFYSPGYSLSLEEREKRLTRYYDPYHETLQKNLESGRIRFLIDGHSMTAFGPAIGPDRGKARPPICIGNLGDAARASRGVPLSCPNELAHRLRDNLDQLLKNVIAEAGFSEGVKLNHPFGGGYILEKYSAPPFSIPGVMIEVNRALYLDEETLIPIPGRIEKIAQSMKKFAAFALADLAV